MIKLSERLTSGDCVGQGLYLIGDPARRIKVGKGILAARPAAQVAGNGSARKYVSNPRVLGLIGGPGSEEDTYALEALIHLCLVGGGHSYGDKQNSEWFNPCDELLSLIERVQSIPYHVFSVDDESKRMVTAERGGQEIVHQDCVLNKAHINLPTIGSPGVMWIANTLDYRKNLGEAARQCGHQGTTLGRKWEYVSRFMPKYGLEIPRITLPQARKKKKPGSNRSIGGRCFMKIDWNQPSSAAFRQSRGWKP